jgi:hypothetical protein
MGRFLGGCKCWWGMGWVVFNRFWGLTSLRLNTDETPISPILVGGVQESNPTIGAVKLRRSWGTRWGAAWVFTSPPVTVKLSRMGHPDFGWCAEEDRSRSLRDDKLKGDVQFGMGNLGL